MVAVGRNTSCGADDAGLITDQSRWLSGRQLADDGYETTFGVDLNSNGFVGV